MPETVICATCTLVALKRRMTGGWIPGGMTRVAVSELEVIWAMAPPMSASGSKYTRSMPVPLIIVDSMCVMPDTEVDMLRSLMMTMRRSMSSADSPV